ncbi:TPA: PP2C family protein-serine/threonine phosphatase [Photobacterium damselae]
MINYIAKGFSEAGRGKPNQDSILIKNLGDEAIVLAIADGMGGKNGGDVASNIAVSIISKEVDASNLSIPSIFQKVKFELESRAAEFPELSHMGTTLTLAIIVGDKVKVGHVGDTRLYHLRQNGIIARTKDQTEVQKLLDDGILSKQRAINYHRRNILLSVLTPNRSYDLQVLDFNLTISDRLLLSTDGAYSLASKLELRDLSVKNNDLNSYVEQVKMLIESKKIRDDYSVVAFQLEER